MKHFIELKKIFICALVFIIGGNFSAYAKTDPNNIQCLPFDKNKKYSYVDAYNIGRECYVTKEFKQAMPYLKFSADHLKEAAYLWAILNFDMLSGSFEETEKYAEISYNKGYPAAALLLGRLYMGCTNSRTFQRGKKNIIPKGLTLEEAKEWLINDLLTRGNPAVTDKSGRRPATAKYWHLECGDISKDFQKAEYWFREALKHGRWAGHFYIHLMIQHHIISPKDGDIEPQEMFKKLAEEHNHIPSKYEIAKYNLDDPNITKEDYKRYIAYLKEIDEKFGRVFEAGDVTYIIGMCYKFGHLFYRGCLKTNVRVGEEYLRKASHNGHTHAIGRIHDDNPLRANSFGDKFFYYFKYIALGAEDDIQ